MILSPTCLLWVYYERKERGGVSTTRDDRIVGLRRRGKRKGKSSSSGERIINFSLSGFCENLKRSRRERGKMRKKIARAYNSYKPMNARDRR